MFGLVLVNSLVKRATDSNVEVSKLHFSAFSRYFAPQTHLHCESNYALHEAFRVLWVEYNKPYFSFSNTVGSLHLYLVSQLIIGITKIVTSFLCSPVLHEPHFLLVF